MREGVFGHAGIIILRFSSMIAEALYSLHLLLPVIFQKNVLPHLLTFPLVQMKRLSGN